MSDKKKKAARKPASKAKSVTRLHAVAGSDPMLSFPAAMKQTGKSMGFIYRCINDGRLPAFKVARSTVFRQSDIDKLMTPIPYTPTAERSYAKNVKPKLGKGKKFDGKAASASRLKVLRSH